MVKTDHVYGETTPHGNELKCHKIMPKKWNNYETEIFSACTNIHMKRTVPKWNNRSIAWIELKMFFLPYYINFRGTR